MKKNILLGVCAGIASYKSCELVRLLIKEGFAVKVVMSPAAKEFVTPLVFKHLSQAPVYLDMFNSSCRDIEHISLTQWAELCVIAPLTANTLSKIAAGICDNLLTTAVCALPQATKVLLVPAMNECMWKNPIIQENAARLKKHKKYVMLTPLKGGLACGVYGEGRMPEPEDILKHIKALLW